MTSRRRFLAGAGLLAAAGTVNRAALAALPDMDSPTTALPVGACPRLAANHAGSSWVRKVSHL